MNLNIRNLKNYHVKFLLLLVFVFSLTGCSGSAKRSASPFFLENIAKFDGKFSVYISDKKLINNSKIESQDCESWQIEIELDKAYRESLNNIIHRMFNNVEFTDRELNEDELASSEIIAQVVFKNHKANATFKVKENTANYNITIKKLHTIFYLDFIISAKSFLDSAYFAVILAVGFLTSLSDLPILKPPLTKQ